MWFDTLEIEKSTFKWDEIAFADERHAHMITWKFYGMENIVCWDKQN